MLLVRNFFSESKLANYLASFDLGAIRPVLFPMRPKALKCSGDASSSRM